MFLNVVVEYYSNYHYSTWYSNLKFLPAPGTGVLEGGLSKLKLRHSILRKGVQLPCAFASERATTIHNKLLTRCIHNVLISENQFLFTYIRLQMNIKYYVKIDFRRNKYEFMSMKYRSNLLHNIQIAKSTPIIPLQNTPTYKYKLVQNQRRRDTPTSSTQTTSIIARAALPDALITWAFVRAICWRYLAHSVLNQALMEIAYEKPLDIECAALRVWDDGNDSNVLRGVGRERCLIICSDRSDRPTTSRRRSQYRSKNSTMKTHYEFKHFHINQTHSVAFAGSCPMLASNLSRPGYVFIGSRQPLYYYGRARINRSYMSCILSSKLCNFWTSFRGRMKCTINTAY